MIRRYRWNGNFTDADLNGQVPPANTVTIKGTNGALTDLEILPNPVSADAAQDLDEYVASGGWALVEVDPPDADLCQLAAFNAAGAILTNATPPTPVVRNEREMLAYADTGTTTSYFTGVMPLDYDNTKDIRVKIWWVAATATTGSTRWVAAIEKLNPNGPNVDVDNFGVDKGVNSPTDSTNGEINAGAISFNNLEADDLLAGNSYRLRLRRQGNAGGDDMVGDAQVMRVALLQ